MLVASSIALHFNLSFSFSESKKKNQAMILTAPHLIRAIRWIPPGVTILGSSCSFLNFWAAIRALTWPFPEWVYSRLEEMLYSNYQAMVGFWYETWSGVEFCFYGDRIPNEPENALYISNHQCSMDWVIPEVLCVKQGGYGGRARYILKDNLKFLPLYGWYLGNRGGIYVKRRKDRDGQRLIRGLNAYVEKNVPLWLVIFPEGTRYDPRPTKAIVRQRSQEYAKSVGIEELSHVLTPRTTGFEVILTHIRGHFKAVYDLTIFYEPFGMQTGSGRSRAPPPDLFGFYSGQCARVHIHVRRIPMEEIPETPEEQRAWLYDAYRQKDRLIEGMLQNGRFEGRKFRHPLPLSISLPPTLLLSTIVIAALCTRYGRIWWLGTFLTFTAVSLISGLVKS